jgi:hypothetical protein
MKINDRENAARVRRSLVGFALVAAFLSFAAVAPFLTRASDDETKKDPKSKIV